MFIDIKLVFEKEIQNLDSMEEQRSEMYEQFEIERERWDQEKKNLYQQLQQV